jgi:hypothetical protein
MPAKTIAAGKPFLGWPGGRGIEQDFVAVTRLALLSDLCGWLG